MGGELYALSRQLVPWHGRESVRINEVEPLCWRGGAHHRDIEMEALMNSPRCSDGASTGGGPSDEYLPSE